MSFTTTSNTDYLVSTQTFSKSANDELLMAMGQYKYYKTTVDSFIWDLKFVQTLDNYMAGNLTTDSLNQSEYTTIKAFMDYQDAMGLGIGTLNPVWESLNELLLTTSLSGDY